MPIETLDALAVSAIDRALSAAGASCMLFAVVTAAWLVMRRRASAHVGHVLFLVPLAPLVFPGVVSVELPAWMQPAPEVGAPVLVEEVDLGFEAFDMPTPVLETRASSPMPRVAPRTLAEGVERPWQVVALLGWAVVVVLLFGRLAFVQWRTHRMLVDARDLDGPEGERVRARLAVLARELGLRRAPRVVETGAVATPAVWGLVRPVLALDRSLVARLDRDQLDWVLAHELAHLARHDLARGAAQRLVQVFWFFHPLVWLTSRVADELRESACDETALSLTDASRRARCAKALVEVVAHGVRRTRPALLLNLNDDKTTMKRRIVRMLDPDLVPARRASLVGSGAVAVFALTSLVDVSFAQQDATSSTRAEIVEVEEVPPVGAPYSKADVALAIDSSVDWLVAQQAADGHWPSGPGTEVDAGEFNVIGTTGFVLLALDGAQREDPRGARAGAIERGRAFLAGVQREDGLFGSEQGYTFMQSHAIATLAWIETRPERDDAWKSAAERAVAVILGARNPYRGWRFDIAPTGDCDAFTTSLMLSALAAADEAGLDVPETASSEPLEYLDQLTESETGRTGYDRRGGNDPRLRDKRESHPAALTQLSTAAALTARITWGQDPARMPALRRGAFLVSEFAPRWDEQAGSIDYVYWLFGTRALAPIGGAGFASWRDALTRALLPNQALDDEGGSWPAIDAWSAEGTEVHATALCTLALQAAQ